MKIDIEEHDQSESMWRKYKLQHDLLKRTLYFCSLIPSYNCLTVLWWAGAGRGEVCHTSDAVHRAWQLCNWTLDNFLEIFSSNLSSAQPVCKVVKGWLAAARWRNPSHCQQPPPSVILAAADLTSSRHFSREVWEISGEMWSGAIFAAECRCLVLSCILCSQHYNSPIVK